MRRWYIVAPFAGARIETSPPPARCSRAGCRSLRGSADRNRRPIGDSAGSAGGRSLRGSADRNMIYRIVVRGVGAGRSLRGSADRNARIAKRLRDRVAVAPFAGARIETSLRHYLHLLARVAPFAGARIETNSRCRCGPWSKRSLPSRERGSKPLPRPAPLPCGQVAPFAGARIETASHA